MHNGYLYLVCEQGVHTCSTVYTKVTDLSEKGSCKIFIAGAPQRVTHRNCGYLMRTILL